MSTETAAATRGEKPMRVIAWRWRSATSLALVTLIGIASFCWPFVVRARGDSQHGSEAPWLFAVLMLFLVTILVAEVIEGGIDAKAIALLGVLAAVATALRPLSGGVTGFQPMFVVIVLAGRVFGRGFGFVVGAVSMFASALLTGGVGPWLPYQVLGAAWIGFGAGCLPRMRGRREVVLLATYGAAAGLAFGLILDLWFWPWATGIGTTISYVPGGAIATNLHHFLALFVLTSLGFDLPRAVGDAVILLAVGGPLLVLLRRAGRRAAFDASPLFVSVHVTSEESNHQRTCEATMGVATTAKGAGLPRTSTSTSSPTLTAGSTRANAIP